MKRNVYTGRCECDAVQYKLKGPLRDSVACHCKQCRRTSGHYFSATAVSNERLSLIKTDGLKWYRSSENAERGFCKKCGSSLFWRRNGEGTTSVCSGTLDDPTGLKTSKHIFVADKGDYYEIADGLPQLEAYL
ncbi:MAG: GFA family protein [Pseudomonadota bacterium]